MGRFVVYWNHRESVIYDKVLDKKIYSICDFSFKVLVSLYDIVGKLNELEEMK